MIKTHNSIRRILHRCMEELISTYDIAKVISLNAALVAFRAKVDIQILNRNGFKESENVKKRLLKKHQIMLDILEDKFKNYWSSYKCIKDLPDCDVNLRNKIWICWWQGLDNAPDIVKACVGSIKRYADKYEVIFITEDNYRIYVKFPYWIEEKYRKGVFSKTHFSDLLRMNILATYGGIWIDSTFFCAGPCFESYMQQPLWSIKRPDYLHCSIAGGYFAGYSLGSSYQNRWIFKVIRDILFEYWKCNDRLIDYLLVDYAVVLAQKHYEDIAVAFCKIEPNNKYCDELCKVLGQPYDEKVWKVLRTDTVLYKLTWKQSFEKEIDGKKTFYGKLMDGTLL